MIYDLSYETASVVIESWEVLRRMENYAERTGRGLLIRYVNTVVMPNTRNDTSGRRLRKEVPTLNVEVVGDPSSF